MADHILVVEDEARIRDIIRDYFTAHGLDCDLARDGEEALDLLRDHDYDAMLLDVLMPNLDGFSVCRVVRAKSRMPILFLTALGSEEDVLQGYALGAADWVPTPSAGAGRRAKKRAVFRRSRGAGDSEPLRGGVIARDPAGHPCTVGGRPVSLTRREYDLLLCLIRNKGQVLSRDQLLDKVWGIDFEGGQRAVDVRIKSLRSALGSAGKQIKTVFKAGYRMEGE